MVYELTETERRVLYSPKERAAEKEKTNVTDVYAGIKYKINDSIAKLIFFSEHLDAMRKGDSKHVTEIKEVSLSPGNFEPILRALMNMDSYPQRHKEELARIMFAMSVRHLLPIYQDDEIYQEMVEEPLNQLLSNLGKLSRHKFYRDNSSLSRVATMLEENLVVSKADDSLAALEKDPKMSDPKNTTK